LRLPKKGLHYEPGSVGTSNAWIFKLRRYDHNVNPIPIIWIKIVGKQLCGGRIRDGDRVTDVVCKWKTKEAFLHAKKVLIDII
jgi:hypothetical protein